MRRCICGMNRLALQSKQGTNCLIIWLESLTPNFLKYEHSKEEASILLNAQASKMLLPQAQVS